MTWKVITALIETIKSQQDRKLSCVARSGKIGVAILGSQNSSVEMLSSLGSRLFAIACFATVTALFAESGRIEKETSALLFVPLSFEAMHPVRIDIGMTFLFCLISLYCEEFVTQLDRLIYSSLFFFICMQLRVLVPVAFIIANAMSGYDNNFC